MMVDDWIVLPRSGSRVRIPSPAPILGDHFRRAATCAAVDELAQHAVASNRPPRLSDILGAGAFGKSAAIPHLVDAMLHLRIERRTVPVGHRVVRRAGRNGIDAKRTTLHRLTHASRATARSRLWSPMHRREQKRLKWCRCETRPNGRSQ